MCIQLALQHHLDTQESEELWEEASTLVATHLSRMEILTISEQGPLAFQCLKAWLEKRVSFSSFPRQVRTFKNELACGKVGSL